LAIILSSLIYFQSLNTSVSLTRLSDSFKSAVNQPNDQNIVLKSVSFQKGFILTKKFLASQVGMDPSKITFKAPQDYFPCNSDAIIFKNDFKGNIYISCSVSSTSDTECTVQLGEIASETC
jgi:hypothetical protein